jgi:hypothetical protein
MSVRHLPRRVQWLNITQAELKSAPLSRGNVRLRRISIRQLGFHRRIIRDRGQPEQGIPAADGLSHDTPAANL